MLRAMPGRAAGRLAIRTTQARRALPRAIKASANGDPRRKLPVNGSPSARSMTAVTIAACRPFGATPLA